MRTSSSPSVHLCHKLQKYKGAHDIRVLPSDNLKLSWGTKNTGEEVWQVAPGPKEWTTVGAAEKAVTRGQDERHSVARRSVTRTLHRQGFLRHSQWEQMQPGGEAEASADALLPRTEGITGER